MRERERERERDRQTERERERERRRFKQNQNAYMVKVLSNTTESTGSKPSHDPRVKLWRGTPQT